MKESSEEVKKIAMEKFGTLKMHDINLIVEIINLASTRGAFRGEELSSVGSVFDNLVNGVNQAIESAIKDIAKEKLSKEDEVLKPLDTIDE